MSSDDRDQAVLAGEGQVLLGRGQGAHGGPPPPGAGCTKWKDDLQGCSKRLTNQGASAQGHPTIVTEQGIFSTGEGRMEDNGLLKVSRRSQLAAPITEMDFKSSQRHSSLAMSEGDRLVGKTGSSSSLRDYAHECKLTCSTGRYVTLFHCSAQRQKDTSTFRIHRTLFNTLV